MHRTELTEALVDAIQGWERASRDRAWALRWKRVAHHQRLKVRRARALTAMWIRVARAGWAEHKRLDAEIARLRAPDPAAAENAVALVQARALLKRAITDRPMMEGAYIDGPLMGQIRRFLDGVE